MNDTKDNQKAGQRKRGVRASRPKLTRALTDAGLKTQAALAERMADLEGLDAAPKDIVNRVFREVPVELLTLERVARALGVPAHSLYKSSDENDPPSDRQNSTDSKKMQLSLLVFIAAVVSISSVWFLLQRPGDVATTDAVTPIALDLGTATLVVMQLDGDLDGELSAAIRATLGEHFNVAADTASALTRDMDTKSAAKLLRSDVVIDGEVSTVERFTGLRVYLFANGVRRQIWAESFQASAAEFYRARVAENVALAVQKATGLPTIRDLPHFPLAPVQDDYLDGEFHMNQPTTELNVKRAQSRFESALRQDSNYARAHAGLCQTLLEEHWMSDEERALKDAAGACGQALQLNPDDPVVAVAHAHFLHRTGRNDEAIALYEDIVERHPLDAAAHEGLASSHFQSYRQTESTDALQRAKTSARRSADVDPLHWRPLFNLGLYEWFDGNVAAAIAASEEALRRNDNEKILGNLGTFYLCNGDNNEARDVYLRAQAANPGSYVGDEFLGMSYYALGDFAESAKLRQRAIDSIGTGAPEIHQMWGNLGDSYRQMGTTDKAQSAYRRAAEIAERDELRGNAAVADNASRAYYYTMLQTLSPGSVPKSVLREISDNLDAVAAQISSASAMRRVAITYIHRDEVDKALDSISAAAASCPGYAKWPELAQFSDEHSAKVHAIQ